MLLRILSVLLVLLTTEPVHASLELPYGGSLELAGHLALLDNSAVDLSIADVASGSAGAFHPLPGHFTAGLGGPRQAWLRFSLHRGNAAPGEWRLRVLPPLLDQVDVYIPEGGGWRKFSVGDSRPFGERAINDRAAVFPIQLARGETQTYYIHLTQDGLFNAYFLLYTPDALAATQSTEGMLFGLYFGGLAALLLINLLHAITLREALFAEFSLYLLVRIIFFFSFDGLLFRYLLPDAPGLNQQILQFAGSVAVASTAPLLIRLLDMCALYPRLARLCQLLGYAAAAIAMTAWVGWFSHVASLLSVIMLLISTTGLVTAFTRLHRSGPMDWLMLAVTLVMVSGQVLIALAGLGIHLGLGADLYGNQIGSIAVALGMYFAVVSRVTEMKQARTASEQVAQEAARTAQQERRARYEQADFVAMLLHEIKTPLAEISTATSVLEHLDDGNQRETAERYDTIHSAVERLDRLVEQSLSRDRQGLDRDALVLRVVHLPALVEHALAQFHTRGRRRVTLHPARDLPPVMADPELLSVALINLLDNADKYSTPGATIRVELGMRESQQTIAVCDAGPVLEPAIAERAFDRFWRGDVSDVGGAGLGLYLVRKIAEAHGGGVALETGPEPENRFIIALPLENP